MNVRLICGFTTLGILIPSIGKAEEGSFVQRFVRSAEELNKIEKIEATEKVAGPVENIVKFSTNVGDAKRFMDLRRSQEALRPGTIQDHSSAVANTVCSVVETAVDGVCDIAEPVAKVAAANGELANLDRRDVEAFLKGNSPDEAGRLLAESLKKREIEERQVVERYRQSVLGKEDTKHPEADSKPIVESMLDYVFSDYIEQHGREIRLKLDRKMIARQEVVLPVKLPDCGSPEHLASADLSKCSSPIGDQRKATLARLADTRGAGLRPDERDAPWQCIPGANYWEGGCFNGDSPPTFSIVDGSGPSYEDLINQIAKQNQYNQQMNTYQPPNHKEFYECASPPC